jgi:hypothetical protein
MRAKLIYMAHAQETHAVECFGLEDLQGTKRPCSSGRTKSLERSPSHLNRDECPQPGASNHVGGRQPVRDSKVWSRRGGSCRSSSISPEAFDITVIS